MVAPSDFGSTLSHVARSLDREVTRLSRLGTATDRYRASRAVDSARDARTRLQGLAPAMEAAGDPAAVQQVRTATALLGQFEHGVAGAPDPQVLAGMRDGALAPARDAVVAAHQAVTGRPVWNRFEQWGRRFAGVGATAEDPTAPISSARAHAAPRAAAATATWAPPQLPAALTAHGSRDVTSLARDGALEPVAGRDEEIAEVVEILTRKRQNNVALIGEPGVGKTAIAEALAQKIVAGEIPELRNHVVVSLNLDAMNSKNRGEFENRLTAAVAAAESMNGKVILFADEMHNLLSAGSHSNASDVGGNILKPALARGKLRMLGATTLEEFRTGVEKDAAFARRFEQVRIAEPTLESTREIAARVATKLEDDYQVSFPAELAHQAADVASRYVRSTKRPDSVIKVLTPMATLARREAIKAGQDLTTQPAAVTIEHLKAAVERVAGVPVSIGEIDSARAERVLNAADHLHGWVKGQEQAVDAVATSLQRAEAGIRAPGRPIASFLFPGPTGVGKTELTRGISDLLFGDPERMFRIDGSEFQHAGSELRLTHGDKGGAGLLTEHVRRNPYSVVLFDEIEKANPATHKLLLQILDAGRLTDGSGRNVDFTNTVVVMTTNQGAKQILVAAPEQRAEAARDAARSLFSPELYNRIGEVVPFRSLTRDEIREVAAKLAKVEVDAPLREAKGIGVDFDDGALELIADAGFTDDLGARPVRRALERFVSTPLARPVLRGEVSSGEQVLVTGSGDGRLLMKVGDRVVAESTPVPVEPPKAEQAAEDPMQQIQDMLRNFGGNGS